MCECVSVRVREKSVVACECVLGVSVQACHYVSKCVYAGACMSTGKQCSELR